MLAYTLLADSTFEFSIGAILSLVTLGIAIGVVRHKVETVKSALEAHEQLYREDRKDTELRLRALERSEDRRKGAEHAKHGRSPADTTITREFSKRGSDY